MFNFIKSLFKSKQTEEHKAVSSTEIKPIHTVDEVRDHTKEQMYEPHFDYKTHPQGFVYVMTNEDLPDNIKIGMTVRKDIGKRCTELTQDKYGFQLTPDGIISKPWKALFFGDIAHPWDVEQELHKLYDEYRRPASELFKMDPSIVIEELKRRGAVGCYIPPEFRSEGAVGTEGLIDTEHSVQQIEQQHIYKESNKTMEHFEYSPTFDIEKLKDYILNRAFVSVISEGREMGKTNSDPFHEAKEVIRQLHVNTNQIVDGVIEGATNKIKHHILLQLTYKDDPEVVELHSELTAGHARNREALKSLKSSFDFNTYKLGHPIDGIISTLASKYIDEVKHGVMERDLGRNSYE